MSISGVSTSTFTIELQAPSLPATAAGGSSSSLLPVIDDLSFYPAGADISSNTYTAFFGVGSVTAGNQTAYTVYDGLGRKKYTLDTYKNIRQKNSYSFQSMATPSLTANVSSITPLAEGMNTFTASPNCVDGAIYKWQLNGTGTLISGTPTPDGGSTISYNIGQKSNTIHLEVSHPLSSVYPTVTKDVNFNVTMVPCTATICAAGAGAMQYCGASYVTTGTFSCSGVTAPPDPTGTTFAVSSISVSETITGFQWQQMDYGTSTWVNMTTTPQYTFDQMPKIGHGGRLGYDVRCVITTNTGRTGTSNTITVVVNTNNCP